MYEGSVHSYHTSAPSHADYQPPLSRSPSRNSVYSQPMRRSPSRNSVYSQPMRRSPSQNSVYAQPMRRSPSQSSVYAQPVDYVDPAAELGYDAISKHLSQPAPSVSNYMSVRSSPTSSIYSNMPLVPYRQQG